MCGIYFAHPVTKSQFDDFLELKSPEISSIRLRGADDFQIKLINDSIVAFSRLAIRNLQDGTQPYHNVEKKFISAVNGELFNDDEIFSELIAYGCREDEIPTGDMQLLAYAIRILGTKIIPKLNGQFAGYIYSHLDKELLFFRDHVGEKPLFYRNLNDTIEITSSPSILPKSIDDYETLRSLLIFGYVPDNELLCEWKELPPGSFCSIILGPKLEVSPVKFWSWPIASTGQTRFTRDELYEHIRESVSRQLVTDVPYCSFLSGGIDSAIITKAVSDLQGSKVETFSLHFKDSKYSEIQAARTVANLLGCNLNVVEVSSEDLASNIDGCLNSITFPFIDSASLSLFSLTQYVSGKFKVALTGDGGDELFGGYVLEEKENLLKFARKLTPLSSLILKGFVGIFKSNSDDYLNLSMKLKRALTVIEDTNLGVSALALSPIAGTPLARRFLSESQRHGISRDASVSTSLYYREFVLPKVYLAKSDRMGMANSVEIRSPFLDTRLINYVTSNLATKRSYSKFWLKEIGMQFLPKEVILAKKHGFSSPMHQILRHYPRPKWSLHHLGISSTDANHYWNKACSGDQNMGLLCWGLLVVNHFILKGEEENS
jgi:asparagine synthase (glutamine-hydrolysing)